MKKFTTKFWRPLKVRVELLVGAFDFGVVRPINKPSWTWIPRIMWDRRCINREILWGRWYFIFDTRCLKTKSPNHRI